MNFPINTRVIIQDGSDLDGQHGYVFAFNKNDNPFNPLEDKGVRQIAVDGMRGPSVEVQTAKLQRERGSHQTNGSEAPLL